MSAHEFTRAIRHARAGKLSQLKSLLSTDTEAANPHLDIHGLEAYLIIDTSNRISMTQKSQCTKTERSTTSLSSVKIIATFH